MDAISFFIKSLVVAFMAIVLMQVKVGGVTIEDHVLNFVHGSAAAEPLHNVADGAVKAIRNGWNTVTRWINQNRPAVGDRAASLLNLNRSEKFREEQAKKKSAERMASSPEMD